MPPCSSWSQVRALWRAGGFPAALALQWVCLGGSPPACPGRERNVWPDPEFCPVALECLVCQWFANSPRGHVPRSQRRPRSLVGAEHRSQKLTAFVSASLLSVYVTFKLEPEPTTVYQGHTAMFQCQAEGDPMPHIQWKGKDKILDPGKLLPRYTASIPNRNVAQRGVPRAYPARGRRWCGLGFPARGGHTVGCLRVPGPGLSRPRGSLFCHSLPSCS